MSNIWELLQEFTCFHSSNLKITNKLILFFHCCKVLTNLDPWKIWKLSPLHNEASRNLWQSEALRIWSILYLFILDLVLWSLHVSIAMNLNAVLHFTPSKMRLKKHVQKYAKLMHSVQEIFVKHMYQNRMSHVHLCMSMHFYAFLCIPEA